MNPIIEMTKQFANGRSFCFAETEQGLGIVIKDEPGYHQMHGVDAKLADDLNREAGISTSEEAVIICSSMRGSATLNELAVITLICIAMVAVLGLFEGWL